MSAIDVSSQTRKKFLRPPSYLIEYSFYGTIAYSMLGGALGLTIPLLGAGLLAGLAVMCVLHFGQNSGTVFRPVSLALWCALSVLLLQLALHEESFMDAGIRSFLTWILSLIVIQSLGFRKGFLHRFAIVSFLIGCATLPYLKVYVSTGELTRIGVSADVGLANPNTFSQWFGFCLVYFVIAGIQAKNTAIKFAFWSAGFLCLYLVGITVSRGNLLGAFIAIAFAFKNVLRRSFAPILALLFAGWLIYLSGIFDDLIGFYLQRGAEETGRSYLWSVSLSKFLDAWWVGVGLSESSVVLPDSGYRTSPHNSLLFIAVSSGVVPLVCFVGYLVRASREAFYANGKQVSDAPFKFPLMIFALLTMMLSSNAFMSSWHVVVLSLALTAGDVRGIRHERSNKAPTGSVPG